MHRRLILIAAIALTVAPGASAATPKHGQLLHKSKLTNGAALASASRNWLVKYRSVDVDGKPNVVSGVVSLPKGKPPKNGWPVITYAHGTTGIADQCAPSKDSPSNPAHQNNTYAPPLLNRWLRAGYVVARTDYQGLGTPGIHDYQVGVAEGRSTLDIARAARHVDKRVSNRFAIAGHSQGGHAGLWAAKLAPSWTPDLKLHATVVFAPGSHVGELMSLLPVAPEGPGGYSAADTAMIIRSMNTVYPSLNLPSLFTDQFAALYPQTLTKCEPQLAQSDSIGGLSLREIFKKDADISAFVAAVDRNDPEHLTIRSPLDVEQGKADERIPQGLTDDLVKKLRSRGGHVVYRKYARTSHNGVLVSAAAHATKYLKQHLR